MGVLGRNQEVIFSIFILFECLINIDLSNYRSLSKVVSSPRLRSWHKVRAHSRRAKKWNGT